MAGKTFLAELNSLAGGLNEASAEKLEGDELSVCENMHVDGPSLIQREGREELAGPYTEDILSVFRYKPSFDTAETTILGCESTIARIVGTAIEQIPVVDGVVYPSSANRWWGKQYKDEFFMARRGSGGVKRLYGPSSMEAGLSAPLTPPTATDGGAGKKVGGVYRLAYRYYNTLTGARSNWSPLSLEVTIADNHRIAMASIGVSPNPQVNARQIGATKPDGGVIYLVGQINDNTTTTFDENALDPDEYGEADVDVLGAPTTDIRNLAPPAQAWVIEGHKERLFVLNEQGMSWSEAGLWQSFKSTSFIPVDKGTGLFSWDGHGLVMATDGPVWILLGDTPSEWRKELFSAQHRCPAGQSMANGDGTLFWYTGVNIVSSQGGAPSILPRIERIRETLDSIPEAQKSDVIGETIPAKGWYVLSVPTDDGRKVIVYDYVRSAFAVFPDGPQTLALLASDSGAEILFAAFADDFTLYEYLTGETDDGTFISCRFRTSKIGGQDSHRITRRISLHTPALDAVVTVRILHDDVEVEERTGVSLNRTGPKRITVGASGRPGSYIQVEIEKTSGSDRLRVDRVHIEGVEIRRRVMAI